MIQLRGYQKDVANKINNHFSNNKRKVVMAMCPGAGKTITSLAIAENTKGKVLILAHGTSALRTQWHKRVEEYGITKKDITIDLPQSLNNKDLEEVELLIVDEAHEFYFAQMVQAIVKKTRPKKILLLTGTPSRFIRRKFPIVLVAADKLLDQDYLSNVYFGHVSSCDKILDRDYTQDGNLRKSYKHKHIEQDMDNMLKAIIKRLKSSYSKSKPYVSKLTSWAPVLGELHKTMIACNNIEQARMVRDYLVKKIKSGVALSVHLDDKDSIEIENFINDPKIKVLIVVRRGILGFDLDELVNVIDMSGSRNINIIYQLMSRVMRKHKDHKMKYFFKVAPENEAKLSEFYLRAAISMVHTDFISLFDGKNLNKLKMPVTMKKRKQRKKSSAVTVKKSTKHVPVDADLVVIIDNLIEMTQLYNKAGEQFNEVSYITLEAVKHQLKGAQRLIVNITEENLMHMIKTGEVDERIYE